MQKNVLITGASVGIGAELADLMAGEGFSLALVAKDQSRLQKRAGELEQKYQKPVIALAHDLSLGESPRQIFQELHSRNFPVSILINNAGFGVYGNFAQTDLDQELAMLEVNMASLVQLTKLFLRPMLERKEGRIMNVASTAAFQPGPGLALYSASKAFVHSFTVALALEVENTGVTVTSLCPGGTETEFQKRAGMERSAVFNSKSLRPMSARSVAEIGYKAMMQGRPQVVAGWKNKIMAAGSRRLPLLWAARVARRLNRDR